MVLAVVVLFFALFALSIAYIGYILLAAAGLFLLRKVYLLFNKNNRVGAQSAHTERPFEPGHVEAGEFKQGPGRIIDHDE